MKLEDLQGELYFGLDLPHLGVLCKYIREGRKILPTQIANRCGCDLTMITRSFEELNNLGSKNFECYLAFLQDEDFVKNNPLTSKQADLLRSLYKSRNKPAQRERHLEASCISFGDISSHNPARPAALSELVNLLAKESQPALIMDDFWFIHALNEAQLRLYGLHSTSPFLCRWEAWHTIAGKIPTDSPIRKAHDETGQFIPPTIVFFFEHEFVQLHLFTLQMRRLIGRLLELSVKHQYELHKWWEQLISFRLPYNTESVPRTVTINDTTILTRPKITEVRSITHASGYVSNYSLVVWEVTSFSDSSMGKGKSGVKTPQPVYFAADYDRDREFHVNTWSDVKPFLLELSR